MTFQLVFQPKLSIIQSVNILAKMVNMLPHILVLLFVAVTGSIAFVPHQLDARAATCKKDNCFTWASKTKGSAWCSTYVRSTKYTTVTSTSRKLISTTTTLPNVYTTITKTDLTTVTGLVSLGVIAPNPTTTVTVTTTTTMVPAKKAKRGDPYPANSITSACSCLISAIPTTNKTSTRTASATSTITVTSPPKSTITALVTITQTTTTALVQTNLLPPLGTDTVTTTVTETTTPTACPTAAAYTATFDDLPFADTAPGLANYQGKRYQDSLGGQDGICVLQGSLRGAFLGCTTANGYNGSIAVSSIDPTMGFRVVQLQAALNTCVDCNLYYTCVATCGIDGNGRVPRGTFVTAGLYRYILPATDSYFNSCLFYAKTGSSVNYDAFVYT
ncbi:hypothetical protein K402DRAFT_58335 [Aulographum hederae CBS 113979]|uniref:Uncharacterized protein n=1 Tax=Aulographum hederae CBS 113979 TaxID=1176131 RepID=A0A6G1H295_9PEZI|nr:hypothetical protein K402DRAFT_58335 [Aulographum hederae CBS 113979]